MIKVWDPTAEAKNSRQQLARRLPALHGMRLGLLDIGKVNSNHLLQSLREIFEEQGEGITTTVSLLKPNFSMPAPRAQIEQLAEKCDFVITGVGD